MDGAGPRPAKTAWGVGPARAVLTTRDGTHLAGAGRARRNPAGFPVSEIGDEPAVTRALADLAEKSPRLPRRALPRRASRSESVIT
ncbi:dsRBD fold-containing protein [Planobispora takensis]|uniref:dsRBD fold-containing protein n=1 Tax=Planobispora takensis TaxID=1367882 RepID=UPI001943A01E|nr:dsRBD fold-containing protein [Planobispora takensis]